MHRPRPLEEFLASEMTSMFSSLQTQSVGVLALDATMRILACNAAAAQMLGVAAAALIGQKCNEVPWNAIREDGAPFASEEYPCALIEATGKPIHGLRMGVWNPQSESHVWLLLNADLEFSAGGNVSRVIFTFVDFTPLRQVHAQLQEKNDWLHFILDTLKASIWVLDLKNDTFIRDGYYSQQLDALGEESHLRVQSYVEEEDRQRMQEALQAIRQGETQYAVDFRLRLPDQSLSWQSAQGVVLFDEAGEPDRLIGMTLDITERMKTKEELRVSQALFQTFMENSPACAFIKDEEGRFIFANPAIERHHYHASRGGVLGKRNSDLYPETMATALEANDEAARRSAQPVGMMESSRPYGGHSDWYVIRFPLTDAQGRSLLGGMAIDLSALFDAQLTLRDNEERLRSILNSLPDIVWSRHFDTGRLLYASPAFEKVTGYGLAELLEDAGLWDKLLHPEDQSKFQQYLKQVREQATATTEYRLRRRSGEDRWLHDEAHIVYNDEGAPIRIDGIARDITERKRAERELRKANRRMLNILESVTDGFLMLDRQWTVSYSNPRAEQMLQTSRAELLGKNIWETLRIGAEHPVYHTLTRALAKQMPLSVEMHYPPQDAWIQINAHPSQAGLSVYLQDISDRKQAEQRLHTQIALQKRHLTGMVRAMSRVVERRDPFTAQHQKNTSCLAQAIGQEMSLPEEKLETLRFGALLHDIGKIAVPTELLMVPRPLTEAEFEIVQAHAKNGYDILREIDLMPEVALMALQHHERLDGSGYPNGLMGEQMIQEARILAVADVLNAMVSERPYRAPHDIESALRELLSGKGTKYDAEAVEACLRVCAKHNFDYQEILDSCSA